MGEELKRTVPVSQRLKVAQQLIKIIREDKKTFQDVAAASNGRLTYLKVSKICGGKYVYDIVDLQYVLDVLGYDIALIRRDKQNY